MEQLTGDHELREFVDPRYKKKKMVAQLEGGYYADVEAECQAFHICAGDGEGGLTKFSFLCPNGTLFQQQYFVCDWWFNVDCSIAESLYSRYDKYFLLFYVAFAYSVSPCSFL